MARNGRSIATGAGRTRSGGHSERVIDPRIARRFSFLAALLAITLLVVDVVEPNGWTVDETSLGLIAILLAIPLIEQIEKLKIGGVEADFRARVDNLEHLVGDLSDHAVEGDADAPPGTERAAAGPVAARVINRIVWIDDQPENNRLEVAELNKRFDVIPVTRTGAGLNEVAKQPNETAVITHAASGMGASRDENAGRKVIEEVRERFGEVPVYVYTSEDTATARGSELEAARANLVTASFTELARRIREDARAGFESQVATVLRDVAESVAEGAAGLDFVARLGNARIGVQAKDYRRSPKDWAIERVVGLLTTQIEANTIDRGVVVAPRDVFGAARARMPATPIQMVPLDELRSTIEGAAAT
jgi:hypothetical protein